jgi:hypothetical protein
MFLLVLLACAADNDLAFTCPETTEEVAPDDASALGFSADDALAALGTSQELSVAWQISYGPTSGDFSVDLTPNGAPLLVDTGDPSAPYGTCRVGSSLRVPLTLDLVLDGGGIVASLDGALDAWALDDLGWGTAEDTLVTPTGDFAAEANAAVSGSDATRVVESWEISLAGTGSGGEAWLIYRFEDSDSGGVGTLLAGTWGDAVW